jgi:class 3 adenylate cyclase
LAENKPRGRLINQVIAPLAVIVLMFALIQVFVAYSFVTVLKGELKDGLKKEFAATEDTTSAILKEQGSQVLRHHTEEVLAQQLQYLETQKHRFANAEELIAFCIADSHFQKLALRTFGKYGYTNTSIKVGDKLFCVAHAKKELLGKDLFEVVRLLPEDAKKKQNVDEFVKNWSMQVSGTVEFEQTETFLPAHIPESVGRRKLAHEVWSEILGFGFVVETTTYLAEFLEPVNQIMAKHNQALDNIENKIVSGLIFWLKVSFALVLLSLLSIVGVAVISNKWLIQSPLRVIYAGLQSFSRSDFSRRIDCDANNELGSIAEISNNTADRLAEAISCLEESHRGLEEKVAQRTADLEKANTALRVKTQQAERLLKNTLPDVIATRLRDGEETIVDDFALATVIFTDFKGFTQLTETVTPSRLVTALNEVFAKFDEMASELGIEKIKTIGDAYMAVGGVPARDDNHPQKVVELGLRMRDYIAERQNNKAMLPFQIRIGIHSGPVLAGVIGRSKFSYDLWGDTVNIASRCESSSEPMKVNISESTYKLVKDIFKCESRGMIAAKGKGELPMYFVERR